MRVTPWFWLAGVFTGYSLLRDRHFDLLLVWIACLFVSILIHELGHAIAGRCFGWPSDVILYHFGGVTRFAHQAGFSTGRSVVVSFAGPWAGFLLYGVVLGVEFYLNKTRPDAGLAARRKDAISLFAIMQLKWINLYWGLVNLLPVLPLDGGHISESLLERYRPRDGALWCLRISTAVGALAAAVVLFDRPPLPGILFALLAVENFQRLEQYRGGW